MRRNSLDLAKQYPHQRQKDDTEWLAVLHHLGRHIDDIVLDPALADADVLTGAQQCAERPQKKELLGARHALHDAHGLGEFLPLDGRARGDDGRREHLTHLVGAVVLQVARVDAGLEHLVGEKNDAL